MVQTADRNIQNYSGWQSCFRLYTVIYYNNFLKCMLSLIASRYFALLTTTYESHQNANLWRGSRILQWRVSNPSERGTAPPQLFWPMLPEPNNFLAYRRNRWRRAVVRHRSRAMSNPLLSSYSSCFVFTKHPVQLKTATTCFQNMFFSKKGT